jgi:hypothetical protein
MSPYKPRCKLTIFNAAYVTDNDLFDTDLDRLSVADHSELVLFVDCPLQSTELYFLAPVVECCYSRNYDNGN